MKADPITARIRQICCIGLPGELLMASLLPALRELVPSDSAGFFWVDARGEMRNLYAERLLPADVMSLYFERFYNGGQASFRKAFLKRASGDEDVVSTTADDSLQKTEYYNEILRRLDAHHVLYGVVRGEARALGQLSLYRGAESPAFTARERADLASVMRYVAHGVAAGSGTPSAPEAAIAFGESDDESMLIADRTGKVCHDSAKARRLLLLATTSEFNPETLGAAVNERAQQAVNTVCARLQAVARGEDTAPPVLVLDSKWGRFVIRAYWLDDGPQSPSSLVGVHILRQEPLVLRFVNAMANLPLSQQQREIAVHLAQGRSNHEIGALLGVTANTVSYHIKQLFAKLDVHDRAGAVARISGGPSAGKN